MSEQREPLPDALARQKSRRFVSPPTRPGGDGKAQQDPALPTRGLQFAGLGRQTHNKDGDQAKNNFPEWSASEWPKKIRNPWNPFSAEGGDDVLPNKNVCSAHPITLLRIMSLLCHCFYWYYYVKMT